MSLRIYSSDHYLQAGLREFARHWPEEGAIIDVDAFPEVPLPVGMLHGGYRVVFLLSEENSDLLLAYLGHGIHIPVRILPRSVDFPRLAHALSHPRSDIFLEARRPGLTRTEAKILAQFVEGQDTVGENGRFPPIPGLTAKYTGFYRRRLMSRFGFRTPQMFYLHLLALTRFFTFILDESGFQL